jgi:hypothetical protein
MVRQAVPPILVLAHRGCRWIGFAFLAVRGSPVLGAIAAIAACASLFLAALTAEWLSGVGPWTDWLSRPVGLPAWLFIPNIVFWWHVGGMSAWKTATRRW